VQALRWHKVGSVPSCIVGTALSLRKGNAVPKERSLYCDMHKHTSWHVTLHIVVVIAYCDLSLHCTLDTAYACACAARCSIAQWQYAMTDPKLNSSPHSNHTLHETTSEQTARLVSNARK
jgi:hypothetical protein